MPDKDTLLEQLRVVQDQRALQRKTRFRLSRLDRYRAEIVYLNRVGASLEDIRLWLREYQQIKVHATTISRALQRWDAEEG